MKVYTKESIEKLKKEANLARILTALGYRKEGWSPIFDCPVCGYQKRLHLNSDDTKYYCFNCEAKGDVIDLLMEGWSKTYTRSIEYLAAMVNITLDECKEDSSNNESEKTKEAEKTLIKNIRETIESLREELKINFHNLNYNDPMTPVFIKIYNALNREM